VPIASVARETRSLNGQDGADATLADGRQQLLEARSGDPTAGATKIVVNYLNVAPTELVPALDQAVLTPLAFEIVCNLIGRGLTDINDGTARQCSAVILLIVRPLIVHPFASWRSVGDHLRQKHLEQCHHGRSLKWR
jgi:hypothetical protein